MKKRMFLFASGLLLFFLFSCQVSEPDLYQGYDYLEYAVGAKSEVVNTVNGAQESVDAVLFSLSDNDLKSALELAASRGVTVRLMVDSSNSSTISGISSAIQTKSGNGNGNLKSNFFIIDGTNVLLLSSHNITLNKFVFFKMSDKELINGFQNEFDQMFDDGHFGNGSDVEGAKMPLNYVQSYDINGNDVEIYFLPQDSPMSRLFGRSALAREDLTIYSRYVDNNRFCAYWNEFISGGITVHTYLGQENLSKTAMFNLLLNGEKGMILNDSIDFNIVFMDVDKEYRSAVMTSFDWDENNSLAHSDGVMMIVSGPIVTNLFQEVTEFVTPIPDSGYTVSNITVQKTFATYDVIVSEIGFNRIGDVWQGKFFELRNMTSNYVDLSGFTVIITNKNRISEPDHFSIPYGTVLAPSKYFVVCGDTLVYSYVDLVWSDIFILSSGFVITLYDANGNCIDAAGSITSGIKSGSGLPGTISATDPDQSSSRILSPVGNGLLSGSWSATATPKNINPTYISEMVATPGAD